MLGRVVGYFFLAMMILALVLSFAGVTNLDFGNNYYNFLNNLSVRFNEVKFSIPSIPKVNKIPSASWDDVQGLISFFRWFGNVFIGILNALITVLNCLVMLLNVFIHLIQFIYTIIECVINFRNSVAPVGMSIA